MFTIGMPVYKRPHYVRQALDSALRQTFQDYEILISDDSPGDEVRSIVDAAASPKIRYQQNDPPLGVLKKLNDFLAAARHEWLVILCDDDAFEPSFLETLARRIRENPDAVLVRTRYKLIDSAGRVLRDDRLNPERMSPHEFLSMLFKPESESFKMNVSGIAFRPRLLRAAGGFRDFYRGWHSDRIAWATLGSAGPSVCDPEPLCRIRLHAESFSGSVEGDLDASLRTTRDMKAAAEQIFDRLVATANGEEDLRLAAEGREALAAYCRRHNARSLDHGLVQALVSKNDPASKSCKDILARYGELDLRVPASAKLYAALSYLPRPLRAPLVGAILDYKSKKWNA